MLVCFFFSSRRRHTRLQGDWSSDVCSSDLAFRQLTGQQDVGVELRVDPSNALVVESGELAWLHLPGRDGACLFDCTLQRPRVIDHQLTVSSPHPDPPPQAGEGDKEKPARKPWRAI